MNSQSTALTRGDDAPVLRPLLLVLVAAPLVVLPGHVDFSRLPQLAFVQLSTLVLGLAWLGGGGRGVATGRRLPLDAPLLAFMGWSALSLLTSADPGEGLRTFGHWGACALAYVLVSRIVRPADVPRVGAALLLGGTGVAAVGLGQRLFGLDLVPQAIAPAATLANRNLAAGYLIVLVPFALLPFSSRWARVAASAGAALMLTFLPFTRSRTAAVAVGLQLLLLALREPVPGRPTGRSRIRASTLLAGASLVLAAAAWLTLTDAAKARSVSIRVDLAGAAISMGLDRPLLGVGLGGFGSLFPSYGPVITSALGAPLRVESPHAEALQVLAETGLPGLLAALWVVAAAVGRLRRLQRSADPCARRTGLVLALSLAGFAVDATLGFPLRSAVPPFVLAVLLGLLSTPGLPEPRAMRRPLPGRPLRLLPAAALLVMVAGAASSSLLRLEGDSALYEASVLPVVHAQELPPGSGCGPGVTVEPRAEGRFDLVAQGVPLVDVLRCLVERAGLRLEYDGPPPRQAVRVALRGESLAGAIESLLEGLGVSFLLSRDPSGADRLIVFGAPRAQETSRPGTPTRPPGSAAEPRPAEDFSDEPPQPSTSGRELPAGVPHDFTPSVPPPFTEMPEPGVVPEPAPMPVEPEELTQLTLQLGRRVRSPVATTGNSPARRSSDKGGGA